MCGVCGKLDRNSLCKKCDIQLQKIAQNKIDRVDKEIFYFEEHIYLFKYEGIIRDMILDYKFNEKSYLYKTFVNFLSKDEKLFEKIKTYDTIIPVPISKKRNKQRGYNQSSIISKEISKCTKMQYINNCLVKTKNVIEQSKLSKEERSKNIQGVYDLKNKEILKNKKILLVDDIYTTGSTVKECCKILQLSEPKYVGVFTIAKD